MPSRESQIKTQPFIAIGGVNERSHDTEQKNHEWSVVEGAFPEFAGLQSRLFGKRLLEKFDQSVLGIFQFWTPMGYGGGIYQFTGTIDFSPWITLGHPIALAKIRTDLPFDLLGYTLDEFGDPTTGHPIGGGETVGSDVPDDRNGGGVGGRRCRMEHEYDDDIYVEYPVAHFASGLGNTYDYDTGLENILDFSCGTAEWNDCSGQPALRPFKLDQPVSSIGAGTHLSWHYGLVYNRFNPFVPYCSQTRHTAARRGSFGYDITALDISKSHKLKLLYNDVLSAPGGTPTPTPNFYDPVPCVSSQSSEEVQWHTTLEGEHLINIVQFGQVLADNVCVNGLSKHMYSHRTLIGLRAYPPISTKRVCGPGGGAGAVLYPVIPACNP